MWYYKDANGVRGPYSNDEICQLAARGVVQRSTLVAKEGEGSWTPLSATRDFVARRDGAFASASPKVLATFGSPGEWRAYCEHLNGIVRAQKLLILLIPSVAAIYFAMSLALVYLPKPDRYLVALMIGLLPGVFLIYGISRLATAMQLNPLPWILAGCVPCIALIALLDLIQRATSTLQAAGIPVGLLGAKPIPIP